jgi:hypothetical protein
MAKEQSPERASFPSDGCSPSTRIIHVCEDTNMGAGFGLCVTDRGEMAKEQSPERASFPSDGCSTSTRIIHVCEDTNVGMNAGVGFGLCVTDRGEHGHSDGCSPSLLNNKALCRQRALFVLTYHKTDLHSHNTVMMFSKGRIERHANASGDHVTGLYGVDDAIVPDTCGTEIG